MAIKLRILLFLVFGIIIMLTVPLESLGITKSRSIPQKSMEANAPDFVLKDLQGNKFKLNDYKGKPVLLIFSTTWCGYCRSKIPYFKNIYTKYSKKGLEIANIDIQEPHDKVFRFSVKYQLPYRVLLDKDGDVSDDYNVRGVPSMILINKEGKIVCWQCNSVEDIINTIIGEKW